MNRRQWALTSGVAIAAAAGGVGWAWWAEHTRGGSSVDSASQAIWSLRFDKPAGGEQLALGPFLGRPLLLNFWATWCAPCVKEMPRLDAFHREHQAQGWQVVGLAVDGPTPVREFLGRVPVGFPIGLAGLTGVDLSRSLGNERGALPFSVVFDRHGAAAFRKLGTVSEEDLAEWTQKLSQAQ